MGKTKKVSRVKKDKINALRKKYDDFLEDDKKRRDRNVYILEHLEKMRSCVATLQINQKGIVLSNNKSTTENPIYVSNSSTSNNDRIIMRRDLMKYRENQLDDYNSILKEISKKYILIPKIHSISPTYPIIEMENNNDSDWKSKYNILEQLKRNEKHEPPEKDVTFCTVQQDSNVLCNIHDIRSEVGNNSINESHSTSKPPCTVIVDGSNFTNDHISNTNEDIPYTDKITEEPVIIQTTNSSLNNNEWTIHSGTDQIQDDKNKEKGIRENTDTENILVLSNESDKQEISAKRNTFNKIITDINVSNQQENIIKKLKVNELKSENNTEDKHDRIVENVTSNEVKSKNNEENDIDKFNNGIAESKNNEETQELKTNFVTISANEMQINDCENKQAEMFYSGDSNQVVEDNQGHEEPETYATDNNYTDEQYNHYKESQLQQAQDESYGNVINEQQEITANYDQNYEQQYVNSYENEYSNQYENQPFENYETHNNYQAENSNFEYQQPEQANTEYINSESYIPSESTPETNLSHNQENYVSQENNDEIDPQQELFQHEMHDMQYDYVEQSRDDIQQQLNVKDGYVESQENNVSGDIGDNTNIQHEMLDMQHDYIVQSHDENQQRLNVEDVYVESQENNVNGNIKDNTTIQHEMLDMQHDYIAQSHDGNQQQVDVEDGYVESQENKVGGDIEDN